jgi:hypothetical protein
MNSSGLSRLREDCPLSRCEAILAISSKSLGRVHTGPGWRSVAEGLVGCFYLVHLDVYYYPKDPSIVSLRLESNPLT